MADESNEFLSKTGLRYFFGRLKTIFVQKESGKGLSTNDYTTAEKTKLSGIEAGAEVNTVTSVNGKTGTVALTASDVGALQDTMVIPSRTSQLTNDSGYLTAETDPVFAASPAHGITAQDISAWNAKSDFSGNYNDLTNKPTIPSNTSDLTNDSNFVADANYIHTDNNYTTTEKNKLAGIEAGAEVNPAFTNSATDPNIVGYYQKTLSADGTQIFASPTFYETTSTSNNARTEGMTRHGISTALAGKANTADIPTKTSDLQNDSGFLTSAVTSFNGSTGAVTYTAPVTSVNGQTGAVTTPNTTYTISISGNVITLTPSTGTAQSITLPVYNGGVQ